MERVDRPRLIAVCIGVDEYEDPTLSSLANAVADAESVARAIEQTQPSAACEVVRVYSGAREGEPTKTRILQTLRGVGTRAGAGDTVVVFFAGHGRGVAGRPMLVPADGDVHHADDVGSLMSVDEVLGAFAGCAARQRFLLLDACQAASGQLAHEDTDGHRGHAGAERGRARGTVSHEFVKGLRTRADEWVMLLACSPGEVAIEHDDHGLFSYFVSAGLRGEADLDADGVVGLGELVQYVGSRVPEVARSLAGLDQHPMVIWRGHATIPLTTVGGVASQTRPAQYDRRPAPGRGFAALWLARSVGGGQWATMPLAAFVKNGVGVMYAIAVALEVLAFAPLPYLGAWLAAAGIAAAGSFLVWRSVLALAVAACERAWHAGGYVTAAVVVAWQLVVLVGVAALPRYATTGVGHGGLLGGAIGLLAIAGVVVVMGINGFQFILALADLLSRGERVPVLSGLAELQRTWFQARFPNRIAMQSIHPLAYLLVFGLVGGGVLVAHIGSLLWQEELSAGQELVIGRDFAVLLLIWMLVAWYQAAHRFVSGQARPQV